MGLRGETAVKLINKWRNSTPHEILSGWFQSYGKLVGRYPIPFLLGTILLNCILSSGLYNLHEETDVKNVYIPTNAISLQENEALENYRNSKETTYTISTMFEGKSGKNLLTNASLSAILQITDYAENHLNVSYNNSYYDYRKLHDTGYSENLEVSGNGLLKVIKRLTTDPKLRHNNSNVQLKFPMIKAYGKKIFVPLVLLDVKSDEADVIQSASIVRIIYVLVQQTATSHLSKQEFLQTCHQFGRKFESYATELNLNHQTDFISYAFHLEVLQLEMAEVTHTTFPMLMASMAMLICFTVSVGISRSCVTTKAWESLAGVISALMAVTSSFGLLFHLGYPFMGTVVTVPFLILAIGVDDMYLVLDSWKRTNQKLSPTERLGETLKEAGVSMAFAAITDMISFGLGIISNIPAVSLFCLFTTVAVAFDFGYQLTFYLSVVSLSGTRESLGFNSCCCCLKSGEKHEARTKLHKKSKGDLNTLKYLQERGFTGMYSDLLNSPFGKLTLLTSFLVYLTIAILGCCAIRAHISPIKFVLNTSPYKRYWDVGEQFYFGQGFLVEFLISSPPDLRDKNAVSSLFSAISDLESTPFSVGRDSTVFWLRDFIDYIDKVVTFDPYTVLNEWLNIAAFGGWKSQLQVDEVNGTILGVTKTHFFTGFKGVSHWNSKLELLQMIRNITRNYPKLNITGFHPDFLFIDLLGSLPDSIAQDAGIGILVLSFVTFVFFPNPLAIYWITFFMMSIMLGVLGYLSWWGADLDPVTVISYTISIGFSVDFTCHVASHYLSSKHANLGIRLEETVEEMGWTTIKCAVSTILGVAALLLVDAYVIQAFVLTVMIVVSIGVYHALAILPVVFSCLM